MKKIVLLTLIAFLPVFVFAASTSMDLSEAIKKQIVKLDAVNINGHYKGKSLKLMLTNTSSSSLEIKVNLGIFLKPDNPAFQPMLLSGEETITLKAHGNGEVEVEVFCGNAPKACPIEGLHYSFLYLGGDTLIKILRFIKEHSLYDYLGQSAVWAITNYHSLGNVYDRSRDSLSRRLIGVIVDATKRPRPIFYTPSIENETPAQPAYQPKMDKIYVPFDIKLSASSVLSIGIFNTQGQWIKSVVERQMFEAGKHDMLAELTIADYDAGKYYVRVMDSEKTLMEKEITVTK